MTKDDIIRMAREAGFLIDTHSQKYQPNCILSTHGLIDENLQRFANLAVAAEREACAKVCEEYTYPAELANAIRNGAMRDAKLNAGWGSEQQAEPPPEWPLVKNILDEYGLDAIAFVAEWKAAQRPWVGLTDEDWEWVADKKETSLDTFAHGAAWAADQLKERNT